MEILKISRSAKSELCLKITPQNYERPQLTSFCGNNNTFECLEQSSYCSQQMATVSKINNKLDSDPCIQRNYLNEITDTNSLPSN